MGLGGVIDRPKAGRQLEAVSTDAVEKMRNAVVGVRWRGGSGASDSQRPKQQRAPETAARDAVGKTRCNS